MLRHVAGHCELRAGRPGGSGGPGEPGHAACREADGWTEIEPGIYGRDRVGPGSTVADFRFVDITERVRGSGGGLTWRQVLTHWDLVENDLADRGIDVGDDALMTTRSWRWLRARILGLLSAPVATEPWSGTPLPANRLQAALMPPPSDESREAK